MSDTNLLSLPQFIKKYLGKQVEYHSFDPKAKYQCVDLVNQYIVEVLGLKPVIGTNAKDFPLKIDKDQFEVLNNTPEFVPVMGDIAIWDKDAGGGAGHIAVVSDNKATVNSFNSLDQNWNKPLFVTLEKHDYSNVSHFLRPKANPFPEFKPLVLGYTEEQIKAIVKERDDLKLKYEETTEKLKTTQEEITGLKTKVTEAEGRADARLNAIEEYSEILKTEPNIEAVRESINSLIKDNDEANKKIIQLEKKYYELEELKKNEIQALKEEIASQNLQIDKIRRENQNLLLRVEKVEEERIKSKPFTDILKDLFSTLGKLK